MSEYTLAMLKTDAFESRVVGDVLATVESEGFRIVEMRLVYLTRDRAGAFYAEHVNRPFFKPLVDFMSSGSVLPMVLARTAAITHWRALLGATDSRQAAANTLRGRHGSKTADIWRNVAHGSDSAASALREIQFFFPGLRMPGVR